LASVAGYQAVRCDIDERLDGFKRECGIAASEPVDAAQMKVWLASLPTALQVKELQLRNAMNDYTALQPLQIGDVVKVPCLTPHSLQHGVRTIEFQTPVYERLIVSFAQKVLTQPGWDTEQAAGLMALDTPEQESFEILIDSDGVKQEKIVDFEDFEVYRCQLEPGKLLQLPASNHYTLLVSISGSLDVLGSVLSEEQAAFIPQQCEMKITAANSNQAVTFLLASPKLVGLS
jgi:mannose-6-phosphate isomerase class I